jgi:hypothetical protein
VGWWDHVPKDPNASVVVASPGLMASLEEQLGDRYIRDEFYHLRPGFFLALYVERGLWAKYLANRPPPKD